MGADPLDAVFFWRAEQLLADYKIPPEFQAKVISPCISARAKAILSKLSLEVTAEYKDMKAVILQELKLSATTYFCLLYTSPSPRDRQKSRMPSSA